MHFETSTTIKGVEFLAFESHADPRGSLTEVFRTSWFPDQVFRQSNLSKSNAGVLRGLHFHHRQADLWTAPAGKVFVALVDTRQSSPTYLAVEAFDLVGPMAVFIPPGVAHGYYAYEPSIVSYMVTELYDGTDEFGVAWDDPDLGVPWPVTDPTLSDRDSANLRWRDIPPSDRP